jgi:AcrR family transcriptional regulator
MSVARAEKAGRNAKRDSIVLTAKTVFLKEGYSATSMATIAALVGGSKATLYHHFPSKQDLFAAVIRDVCEGQAAVFGTLDLESGDLTTALRRFGGDVLRLMLSDDLIAMHRLIAAEAARFPEIGETYYAAAVNVSKDALIRRFQQAMENGRLRKSDPLTAAQHFFELCLAGMHRRRIWNFGPPPTEAEIDAQIDAAVETFLNGYRPR